MIYQNMNSQAEYDDNHDDVDGDEDENYNLNDDYNHSFQLIWNWFLK